MKFWRYISYVFFLTFALLSTSVRGQQSYYFSSIVGNDNNLGTSSSAPWENLSKLESVIPSLGPGSVIYLERGSEWFNVSLLFDNVKGADGSPILITSYGSGDAPVIKGSMTVESFSNSGSLWSCYNSQFSDIDDEIQIIAGVYLNDDLLPLSRMPNEGYYSTGTRGDGTYMEDYDNSWPENHWYGGQVVGRTASWAWDKSYITYNSANAYSLEGFHYPLTKDKTFYFLQNHVNAADQEGEWSYRDKTLSIRSSLDLNYQEVEIPVSRKLIVLNNCEYIKFEGIHFSRSNYSGVSIEKGSYIEFDNCRFSDIGGEAIYISAASNFYFRNSIIEDCYAIGLKMDDVGYSIVENNKFRRIGIFPGLSNGHTRVGSCISCYRAQEPIYFQYNRFDSVMNAFQGHFSADSYYFQYNRIEDYGMTLGDFGAIYIEGESLSSVQKFVKNNIIIRGHASLDSYEMRAGDAYPHAIYLDYDCSNVLLDSNTIIDCNVALFYNRVRNNTAQNNIVLNPGVHMVDGWKTAISWDALTGLNFETLDRNRVLNNEFVLTHQHVKGLLLTGVTVSENVTDYNRWIFPFRADGDIVSIVENYYITQAFTINEWTSFSGLSSHSAYGAPGTKYNASLGVSEEDFVKIIYNDSSSPKSVTLGASYVDKDGIIYDHSVTLAPWYSKVLYYHGESQYENNRPQISNQSFNVDARPPVDNYVGKVIATDPDADQTLRFRISGGNVNSAFSIDQYSGDLYIDPSRIDVETSDNITLTVTVNDNVSESLSASATIQIIFENQPVNRAPVINNQTFTVNYQLELPSLIGQIVATDPDPGQSLTYTIQSGNDNNYFSLTSSNGQLYFRSGLETIPDGTYQLTVRVGDNGSPALADNAVISIVVEQQENMAPVISDQSFTYITEEGASLNIGTVIASDPNGDGLSYRILSSETDAIEIVESTGLLRFKYELDATSSVRLVELTIEVSDDRTPSLSNSAEVVVEIIPYGNAVYINPSNSSNGTGTRENPYNTLNGITLKADHMYLIHRDTELDLSNEIVVNVDNISIQAYGTGNYPPKLRSLNGESILKIMDRSSILIADLHFDASSIVSGIYIVGPNSKDITIRNCMIEGAVYGVRLINTGKVLLKNSLILSNYYGVYNLSGDLEFQYNILTNSYIGLNLLGSGGTTNAFNNVFYSNDLALKSELRALNIHNNIFYQASDVDRAVVSLSGIVSDYNIYYPETPAYFTLDGKGFDDIAELRLAHNQDLNSLVVDPEFINPASGDFTLSESSPAIDNGVALGITTDIYGTPIPYGKAPDIGVMEKTGPNPIHNNSSTAHQFIDLFPNPATDHLRMQFTGFDAGEYTLEIIDVLGSVIRSEEQYIDDFATGRLEIGNLESGMYLLRIRSGNQLTSTRFLKLD